MDRRKFISGTTPFIGSLFFQPNLSYSQTSEPLPYKLEMVKEFVIAGHGNIEKVKQMLNENPNLLFCSHDWGNGDFEEAIEGAGHVGNKEIARYLIHQGARPNIYVLSMLGETEIVKNMLMKYPQLLNGKGPHGFTLLHHASKGGDDARELLDFFKEKGLTDMQKKIK